MGGTLYPVDASAEKRMDALKEVGARLEDIGNVLVRMEESRDQEMRVLGEHLKGWESVVNREKSVWECLNLWSYDASRKTLIAEGWVPTRDITLIQAALRRAQEVSGTSIPPLLHVLPTPHGVQPPTFHRTNKFTEAFQTIIDSYGVASYQEVNPALFATVTFPFLFAVMFGDLGHAVLMTTTAALMILFERKLAKADTGEVCLICPMLFQLDTKYPPDYWHLLLWSLHYFAHGNIQYVYWSHVQRRLLQRNASLPYGMVMAT